MFLMWQEYERNRAEVEKGKEAPRDFYTDIDGATTEDNPKAFPWVKKMPADYDWRTLPHGAFIMVDEAHQEQKFPEKGRPGSRSDDPKVRDLDEARHRGMDFVFITQWPTKVHHELRTLVGRHIHLTRGSVGAAASTKYQWSNAKTNPNSATVQATADEEIWVHDKSLYERYFSATLHTASHRFQWQAKWTGFIAQIIVALLVLWALKALVYDRMIQKQVDKAKSAKVEAPGGSDAAQAAAPPGDLPTAGWVPVNSEGETVEVEAQANLRPQPRACIFTVSTCRCFGADGYRIEQDRAACMAMTLNSDWINLGGNSNVAQVASQFPEGGASVPPVVAAGAGVGPAVTPESVVITAGDGVGNGRVVSSSLPIIGGVQ